MGLTNAERQARWRENHLAKLQKLEARIKELEAGAPGESAPAAIQAALAELQAENAKLKARIEELEAAPAQQKAASALFNRMKARIEELEAEVARLRAATGELPHTPEEWEARRMRAEAERKQRAAAARASRAEKIVAAADPELTREELLVRLADRDTQIKGLKTKLENARFTVRQAIGKKIMLTKAVRRKLLAALHPDRAQTEEEKKKLHDAFVIVEGMPYDPE